MLPWVFNVSIDGVIRTMRVLEKGLNLVKKGEL